MKYIASVSFGKDSLAMLLILLEKNMKLDEVIFYDTGMEFQCIYKIRDRVKPLLQKKNIKYSELKPRMPFEYMMFEKEVKHRDGTCSNGYSWCGGCCRWGTSEKKNTISKYLRKEYGNDYKEYVGIAFDEPNRIKQDEKKIYPLYDLKFTEKQCLEFCKKKGFNWIEEGIDLYDILDRVSCWCCANKNLKELRNYYRFLPKYWDGLKALQSKTNRPFRRSGETIFDLENRFDNEK